MGPNRGYFWLFVSVQASMGLEGPWDVGVAEGCCSWMLVHMSPEQDAERECFLISIFKSVWSPRPWRGATLLQSVSSLLS